MRRSTGRPAAPRSRNGAGFLHHDGRVLKLPSLSLWGGVDPFSGRLTDPALPHCGESVKDRVLMVGEPVGSSSSSAVLLELLHAGNAPVAIVLGRADAIVALGVLASLLLVDTLAVRPSRLTVKVACTECSSVLSRSASRERAAEAAGVR